jgi:subtilisin family serine protease
MANDAYAQIFRRIIVSFKKTDGQGVFAARVNALSDLMKEEHINNTVVGHVAILQAASFEILPPATAASAIEFLSTNIQARKEVDVVEEDRPLQSFAAVVDDPYYQQQWALDRMGAEPAWAHALSVLSGGGSGIIVAVLDTGIHWTHPDLVGHLWDDGFGGHGFNVLTGSKAIFDVDGHGTMLAGTVGAVSDNTEGIAAAGWPIRLMAVKFHDVRTPPSGTYALLAFGWALARNASIIVAAWGLGLPFYWLGLAIDVANAMGVLVVAAAGNDGLNNDELKTYPASYTSDGLISVMASDLEDEKPGFSNYGLNSVHLAAPGVDVLSTDTDVDAVSSRYKSYSGTSAACAHVAYAAALVRTLNPGWTPLQVREHLIDSVDPRPWLHCEARGRLNLTRAVVGPFMLMLPSTGTSWVSGGSGQVTWTRLYKARRAQQVEILLSRDDGPWTLIGGGNNTGACTVDVPADSTTSSARIMLRAVGGPGLFAISEPFTIA